MITPARIDHAGQTDVGFRRSHNQDNLAIQAVHEEAPYQEIGSVFIVADGMGGHAVGEKASELAARIIPHTYQKHARDGVPGALRKAFLEANAAIHAYGEQNHEFKGTGTTGTALVLRGEEGWIAHVGDSRAYRIRGGIIEQLTYDHSYVWEYARRKNIDPDDVKDLPHNVIHRCLGPQPLVEVDLEGPHDLEEGDLFLLCSDGLCGQLTDQEIGVIAGVLPLDEACQFLIDLANLRGGPDNITVILVRVGGQEAVGEVPTTPPKLPGQGLFSRIPWPYLATTIGILLAGGAIGLKVAEIGGNALAILLFLAAIIPCVAGVVGLVIHQRRERERRESQGNYAPHVYRQAACHIDKTILSKLAQAEQALLERAEQEHWDTDQESYKYHHQLAEQYVEAGDLPAAFREYCRAMRPLTEALSRNRSKEESFQPVWDKAQ